MAHRCTETRLITAGASDMCPSCRTSPPAAGKGEALVKPPRVRLRSFLYMLPVMARTGHYRAVLSDQEGRGIGEVWGLCSSVRLGNALLLNMEFFPTRRAEK